MPLYLNHFLNFGFGLAWDPGVVRNGFLAKFHAGLTNFHNFVDVGAQIAPKATQELILMNYLKNQVLKGFGKNPKVAKNI